jgi:hypothetical protein
MKTATRCLILLSPVAIFLFAQQALAVVSPRQPTGEPAQRTLPGDLSVILCERDALVADFQKHGIIDAQISVRRLIPKNPQDRFKISAIRERALKHAIATENHGFAFGQCPDGSAWLVSMPAREEITVAAANVRIPVATVASCAKGSLEIRFAAEKRGRSLLVPRSSERNGDVTATMPNMKGYVGVTCIFSRHRESGPRELALIPSGGAALGVVSKDMDSVRTEDDLLSWMNRRRADESLPPLAIIPDLTNTAKALIGRSSITHDLAAMAKMNESLRSRGIEPLGENRASGRSFADVAMMFWQSPSHRDLFLHPRGHLCGVASQAAEHDTFVSVVVGDRGQAPVARLEK